MARPASELVRAGLTPEQILAAYSPGGWWYARDWRGQKGQRPTPQQVVDTAGALSASAPTVRNKHNADPNEVTPDMTEDEVRAVMQRMGMGAR